MKIKRKFSLLILSSLLSVCLMNTIAFAEVSTNAVSQNETTNAVSQNETADAASSTPAVIATENWHLARTIGTYVNIRSGPGTQYSILYTIPAYSTYGQVDLGYSNSVWYRVKFVAPDGLTSIYGYSSKTYIELTNGD